MVLDPDEEEPVAVIIRNGVFVEPEGGWEQPSRVFRVLMEDERDFLTPSKQKKDTTTSSSGIDMNTVMSLLQTPSLIEASPNGLLDVTK